MRRIAAVMSLVGVALAASFAGGISTAHAAFGQQGPKLTATGEIGNGDFGWTVALSADGNTALVGSPSENGAKGAAWVFVRSGTTWSQEVKLTLPAAGVGNANFGSAVALSGDGNTALVGASFDGDPNWMGAVWVFTRSAATWTQQGVKIQPNDEVGDGQFGLAVSLSTDGNTAAIGAPLDNGQIGAGWIFIRSAGTWTQQGAKLTGAGGAAPSFFGRDAALSGDGNTVVFGGPQDNASAGAAWVFTRSGVTWTAQGAKLVPTDSVGGPEFGASASLSSDGNTALVGGQRDGGFANAKGAAWVFTRSGATWAQQGSKLQPSDEVGNGWFGNGSLSSDGNIAFIAGFLDNSELGAGWIFARSGGVWTQRGSKLTGSGETGAGTMGDGAALSADGGTALIGGTRDNGRIGAAWVFFGTPEAGPAQVPDPGPTSPGPTSPGSTTPGPTTPGLTPAPVLDPPSPDLVAAATPSCLSIPNVVRDQKLNVPGGKVFLVTRQIDDPAAPLRVSVKGAGSARIRSVSFKANGRALPAAGATTALPVSVTLLRLGGNVQRNSVAATVVLAGGKRVVLTQYMIILKCSPPAAVCKRLPDGMSLRCTSGTSLGGKRVKVTASRTVGEVATGSATVTRGRYTVILRSRVPLSAGTYAYKHVVTTQIRTHRVFAIRRVQVS